MSVSYLGPTITVNIRFVGFQVEEFYKVIYREEEVFSLFVFWNVVTKLSLYLPLLNHTISTSGLNVFHPQEKSE